jgi:hypothetical protein
LRLPKILRPSGQSSWIAVLALTIVALTGLFGVYCRSLGIHVLFLNAESGLYLEMAFAGPEQQIGFIKTHVIRSYNGHFAPLAFLAELLQSKLFGTSERAWFWRQMFACGLLGSAAGALVALSARAAGMAQHASWAIGAASAVFLLCAPRIIELVMWPFMVMQLAMLALTAAAACTLLRFLDRRTPTLFAVYLLLAYATMHVFGVGAAISGSALLTGAVVVWLLRDAGEIDAATARRLAQLIAFFFVLTALHGWWMIGGSDAPTESAGPLSVRENVRRFAWLFFGSLFAGARALWARGDMPWPDLSGGDADAVMGAALLLGSITVLGAVAQHYRATGARTHLIAFALLAYPLIAMLIYLALITFRLREVGDAAAILPFLIGSRYVVFPAFFLFMLSAACLLLLPRVVHLAVVPLAGIAAGWAVVGTAHFVFHHMPAIWPHSQQRTEAAWQQVVATARRDIDAGRPVRNMSLTGVHDEFGTDLKRRRHLLEHELNCRGCVHFEGE